MSMFSDMRFARSLSTTPQGFPSRSLAPPAMIPVQTASCGDLCNVPCFKEELVARLKREMPSDTALEEARVLFAALADRNRLRILHALMRADELCVCDVAHVLEVGVSVASHHLRKLREMGILKDRDDGKMVYYSLRSESIARMVSDVVGS